jgi:hypothetical protein
MSLSRQCTTDKCPRLSRALCNCCDKYLCLEHLKDHADRLNEQLTPIGDQFNQLAEELNKITLGETSFIKELDQWCFRAHQNIDHFYQRKRKEFEQFLKEVKQKEERELQKVRDQFKQILEQEEATQENIQLLNNTLRSIEQQIYSIRNQDFVLPPLVINEDLCSFTPKEVKHQNLLPLSSPCQTIIKKETSWLSIAANEKHILISQSSKLCLLNREMKIEKEIAWSYDQIWDMFFSTSLNRFIILTQQDLFNLDGQTMNLIKYPIFDHINTKRKWYCGTTHFQTLFLSMTNSGSSIYEFQMFPSLQFSKEWQSPLSCAKDEYIYDLRSNNSSLGIIILNKKLDETRLELRSLTTLEQQWSYKITSASGIHRIRCCPLLHNQWLGIDAMKSLLLHIDANGTLIKQEKYDPSPRHIVQLDKYLLVVSTMKTFNLHQLF